MKMGGALKEIKTAVLLFAAFSLLTGLIYPLLMTSIIQSAMPEKASGSLIAVDGKIVGSELIGQNFSSPGYFHGRPSAVGYSANGSGASNFGPSSAKLIDQVQQRIVLVRSENNLSSNESVPADLVLSSASGLDPHISLEAAMLQVPRVARARGLNRSEVQELVRENVEPPQFGFLGQERVNVLRLNLALDREGVVKMNNTKDWFH
jgi:K+-transporting ATPase ATPase C chain